MVDDFKYLDAWIDSSAKYLKIRIALAWRTCHQMRNFWKSTLIHSNSTNDIKLNWSQKVNNEVLYGAIEKISTKIRRRFLKFAGHCLCRDDEVVSDLVLWESTHGTRRRGRPPESYIRNLERETGIPASEMRVAMMNRAVWRTFTVRETTIPK